MRSSRKNELIIQTDEGVRFSMELAGPVSRFLAWSIDLGCMLAAGLAIGAVTSALVVVDADVFTALTIIAYFLINIGYGVFLEWLWRGQTIGKRLLRLRVVDATGLKLQFHQIVLRNLLRAVDILPFCYFLGGLVSVISVRSQRLGDLAANTVVARFPEIAPPDLAEVLAGKYNSLRAFPHLEARLRQRVGPREAAVAVEALLRRNEIEPEARVLLFEDIAAELKDRCPFPPSAVEDMTAEQYVRNCVDVLYRSRVSAPGVRAAS